MVATLADPSRFRIVSLLLEGDYCVTDVARRVGLSQSCTTRHMQSLQRAGIVLRTRAGKRVMFRVREGDAGLDRVLELMVLRQPLASQAPASAAASRKASRAAPRPRPRAAHALAVGAQAGARPAPVATDAGKNAPDAITIRAATSAPVATDATEASDSPSDGGPESDPSGTPPASVAVPELEDYLL